MPLNWNRSINPYHATAFHRLDIASDATAAQVASQEQNLLRKLADRPSIPVRGRELSRHDITTASSQLRDPEQRLEELLLVHAPPPKLASALPEIVEELERNLEELIRRWPNPYRAPWAYRQLMPLPAADDIAPPHLELLGLPPAHPWQPSDAVDFDV